MTVLFDLDGVITRRDTMAAVVRQRVGASAWRFALALPVAGALALTSRWPALRACPARLLVRIALLGLRLDDARQLLAEHGVRTAATGLHRDAIAAVRDHQRAGDRVVIITASAADLVRPLLHAAGLADVEVVGSGLADAPGGPRLHPHVFHDTKPIALQRAGIPSAAVRLYTDSLADLPLIRRAQQTVLVNAPARHMRAIRRAVGERVVTAVWT